MNKAEIIKKHAHSLKGQVGASLAIEECEGVMESMFYDVVNFIRYSNKLPQDPVELAKYLHESYEMIAKKQNWNTKESCKVDFSNLPPGNKNIMILLAGKLILDFSGH